MRHRRRLSSHPPFHPILIVLLRLSIIARQASCCVRAALLSVPWRARGAASMGALLARRLAHTPRVWLRCIGRFIRITSISKDSLEMFDCHRVAMAFERRHRVDALAAERKHLLEGGMRRPRHRRDDLVGLGEQQLGCSSLRNEHGMRCSVCMEKGSGRWPWV